MAKIIVSGNLNILGNNGQFESDRSTWGFTDSDGTAVRSSLQKTAGNYSCLFTKDNSPSDSLLLPWKFNDKVVGKKYIVKAKVRTPTSSPIGLADTDLITLTGSLDNILFGFSTIEFTNKTVLQAKDTWVDIDISLLCTNTDFFSYGEGYIRCPAPSANGQIFVDQVEVYEYIDGEEEPDPEDPPPVPEPNPYNIDKVFHSKNPITLTKAAAAGWEALINYRLFNDVRVEDVADSNVFNSKLKVDMYPASNGQVIFYLAEAFRDAFKFIPPPHNASDIIRLTDRIKRFKNFSGELTGTNTTPGTLEESVINLVLWGGIDKYHFPGLNYFTTYMQAHKKFLTWAPLVKEVDRQQEDYLNFWVYDDIPTLKLQLNVYFDDETNVTQVVKTITGTKFTELYQIPAGPSNSGALLVDPEKNVVKYELSILNNDDELISEVRTYIIDQTKHPLTRFFMFINSLGAFEVLRFTGQAVKTTEFSRDLVQKFMSHNYTALDGEFSVNSVLLHRKHNYSSGFITGDLAAAWHEYMNDFLISPVIYNVTNGQREPVVISSATHVNEDQKHERFIQFEAKPAYDDFSFTPEQI